MADYVVQSGEGISAYNLRKQLASAVRSIQWSYAMFWSLSSSQQGVLEWGEGYYNGDIKKRKKSQAMELKAYKLGLRKSKQLRQLYLSMLDGDHADNQGTNKTNSSVLSPEDLTDEEWYYLVCMSYVFVPGQCLPGRALANDETIWLCNAQYAENKGFSRSLLARSASVQTIVCFPYLGGVIELGVTELVGEDPNLLQHCKACLLDFSKPDCHGKYMSVPRYLDNDFDKDKTTMMASCHGNEPAIQGWGFYESVKGDENLTKLNSMDLGSEEDVHYRRTLSTVLKSASRTRRNPCLDRSDSGSSFKGWNQREIVILRRPQTAQNVLKKVLNIVPLMNCRPNYSHEGDNHSEVKRKENEKFRALKSMVPSIKQVDEESILSNTIKYLKELEARVEELESCMSSVGFDGSNRRNNDMEMWEQISDNYDFVKSDNNKKLWMSKRKACHDPQDSGPEASGGQDLKVKVKDREVVIEIRCLYREYIVADIMDAVNNLHMDAYLVRSSTLDDVLSLHLKAKFRGDAVAPAGMIKREMRRIAREC